MIEDKDEDFKIELEQRRTCEFWLTDYYGVGYCRIVGKEHKCHYSKQSEPENCPVMISFNEGKLANENNKV